MFFKIKPLALIVPIVALSACTTIPSGPSVLVLPGASKSFDEFRVDDMSCRQYAAYQIQNVDPNQASLDSGVKSAALGTVLGAAAGAAFDGSSGAAIGAGTGLLFGALAGTNAGNSSGYALQLRYDNAFQQCMYAKGNSIPGAGSFSSPRPKNRSGSPGNYPPPPNTQTPPPSSYTVPGQ